MQISENTSSQEAIDVHIETLEKQVHKVECLHRLLKNKDFKELILDDYLKDEVIRLSMLLGAPAVRSNEKVYESTLKEIETIALFDNHLTTVEQLGNAAKDAIAQYEKSLEVDEDEE